MFGTSESGITGYLRQKAIFRKPQGSIARYLQQKVRSLRNLRRLNETITSIEQLDFSEQDLRENEATLCKFHDLRDVDIRTVNWFMIDFDRLSAGPSNILRFADYFQNVKGVENRMIFADPPHAEPAGIRAKITRFFPGLKNVEIVVPTDSSLDEIPACDAAIATYWTTAYSVLKFKKTKGKFYFIQDYEPLFFPAGTLYGLAEATYRFGFYGIVNTPGLWEAVRSELRAPSKYFMPALDHHVFYPPRRREEGRQFRLFFYGRPDIHRNAFEIGILAVKSLKRKWGDRLQVYVAGSPESLILRSYDGLVNNLGFLPYEETGNLYRQCDAGLVFMLTKHPSYLPFELMACGAVVVSNRNPANAWLLRNQENCLLCDPVPSLVAKQVSNLICDPSLAEKLSTGGLQTVSGLSWENEIEGVFDFIARRGNRFAEAAGAPARECTSN